MASPSKRFDENGVLVERAVETNRWRIAPDGTELVDKESVEAQQDRPYKEPEQPRNWTATKAVASGDVENKTVKKSATKTTKASKKA